MLTSFGGIVGSSSTAFTVADLSYLLIAKVSPFFRAIESIFGLAVTVFLFLEDFSEAHTCGIGLEKTSTTYTRIYAFLIFINIVEVQISYQH